MKLALLSPRYYPTIGGAEINTHGIARELASRHEVSVFTPFRVPSSKHEIKDTVLIHRCYNLLNPLNKYPYLKPKAICPEYIALLSDSYDIVHAFVDRGILISILAKLFSKLKCGSSFLTIYDLASYTDLECDPTQLHLEAISIFSKLSFRPFDHVFSISQRELKLIHMLNKNSSYIPCGVDLQEFDKHEKGDFKRSNNIDDKIMIFDVSRVVRYKGQHILVEAVPEIIRENKDAFFVFTGPWVDMNYVRELKAKVRKLGIEKNVLLTGPLEWSEVLDAYFACELHVLPAYFLTFPDTVVEAWAARKPVVVSNRVDWQGVIEDGKNGFLFDLENRRDLVEKILTLLDDKNLSRTMGQAGRDKVEEIFTFKSIAGEIERIYISNLN